MVEYGDIKNALGECYSQLLNKQFGWDNNNLHTPSSSSPGPFSADIKLQSKQSGM